MCQMLSVRDSSRIHGRVRASGQAHRDSRQQVNQPTHRNRPRPGGERKSHLAFMAAGTIRQLAIVHAILLHRQAVLRVCRMEGRT